MAWKKIENKATYVPTCGVYLGSFKRKIEQDGIEELVDVKVLMRVVDIVSFQEGGKVSWLEGVAVGWQQYKCFQDERRLPFSLREFQKWVEYEQVEDDT